MRNIPNQTTMPDPTRIVCILEMWHSHHCCDITTEFLILCYFHEKSLCRTWCNVHVHHMNILTWAICSFILCNMYRKLANYTMYTMYTIKLKWSVQHVMFLNVLYAGHRSQDLILLESMVCSKHILACIKVFIILPKLRGCFVLYSAHVNTEPNVGVEIDIWSKTDSQVHIFI